MKRKSFNHLTAAGAVAALVTAGAGGYVARAETDARAVNTRPPAAAPGLPGSFADIVQRVAPAVVSIEVEARPLQPTAAFPPGLGERQAWPPRFPGLQPDPSFRPRPAQGAGSGFFISADGYVVTNNHVIENAEKIRVETADKQSLVARVIGRDKATDLAVLKVDVKNAPFVSFEDRAKPRVGDWVVAVGNPYGLGGTATAGIVSAFGRQSGSSYVDYMQIDAPINPGNSGGPTFDLNGRVVGINSAIYSGTGGSVGIGFDIPADVAASVTKQLIANGRVSRGYIGATIQDVTADIAEGLGVAAKGALVASVSPGSPSQVGGLKAGDLVMKIDGRAVANATELTRQVALAQPGETLRFDVQRDGRPLQLSVRTTTRPDEDKLALNEPDSGFEGAALGLQLAPDVDRQGVRVTGVERDSPAARKGLRSGDVIIRAGNRTARAPEDVAGAVEEARSQGRKQLLLLVERGSQRTFVPVELGRG